jgi:hypothetical protein
MELSAFSRLLSANKKTTKDESVRLRAPEDSFSVACGDLRRLTEMSFLLQLADELAFLAAALLAGLFVESRALDVSRQPFLLARLLEALEELVETLVHPDLDADQTLTSQMLLGSGIIAKPLRHRQQKL